MGFVEDVQEWLASKSNSSGFALKKKTKDQVTITIGDDYSFTLWNDYSLRSPDDELEDWVKELEQKKPFKQVKDFLNAARDLFDSLAEEVDEEDNDNNNKHHQEGEDNEEVDDDDDEDDDLVVEDDAWGAAQEYEQPQKKHKSNEERGFDQEFEDYSKKFTTEGVNQVAQDRLMKDLRNLWKAQKAKLNLGFSAEPVENNLYLWNVKLFGFDESDGSLFKDLQKFHKHTGLDHVLLEMKFQPDYPFSPPFIRVMKPRFQFHTGHITIGGSICMELLTTSGWRPSNDIESVLIQIRAEIIAGGARVDFGNMSPYSEYEAREAFLRVARQHGWEK